MGLAFTAAAADHTVLQTRSLTAHHVDTGQRQLQWYLATGGFPFSSLQPHDEKPSDGRKESYEYSSFRQLVHTEAPAGASGLPGLRASPQLMALTLCGSSAHATRTTGQAKKDTRTSTRFTGGSPSVTADRVQQAA